MIANHGITAETTKDAVDNGLFELLYSIACVSSTQVQHQKCCRSAAGNTRKEVSNRRHL